MRSRAEGVLWMTAALLAVAGAAAWQAAPASVSSEAGPRMPAAQPPPIEEPARLSASAQRVIGSNPFRLSRRPALVRYGEEPLPYEEIEAQQSEPSKPRLTLAGITGGPPWEALVEGIPTQQGAVLLRQGEAIAGFHAAHVSSDSAVIHGLDTVWVLGLKHPWP